VLRNNIEIEFFKKKMKELFTPAQPVRDRQHLRGREAKLQQIERAFNSSGKHIFIFGDRGVGKTSLAQTAAFIHQSSDNTPVRVACDNQSTFFQIIKDVSARCVPTSGVVSKKKKSEVFKLGIPGLSADISQSIESGSIPDLRSLNEAVALVSHVAQYHSADPVIIIDEFDQIVDDKEKKLFADFMKQISDQEINIKMIFCGIAKSLNDLIGQHMSTGRYLSPIELEVLTHDARWEIIKSAAKELSYEIPHEFVIRIGQISDGFPYYVHLIGETLFWSIFQDQQKPTMFDSRHFHEGITQAIGEAEPVLKLAYDKAVQKYSDDYEEVLWAVADSQSFRRQISEIYDKSYTSIMKQRKNRILLDRKKFNQRLLNLKKDRHGSVLDGTGAGWYQFHENVVRGYVRLRAQNSGVELGKDHF
jgi:Cdc6-like AAA superfamily ATPase